MIWLPDSLEAVGAVEGELRAGGTDIQERRERGVSEGVVVDLRDVPGLDEIREGAAGLHIGARVTIAALAADARVRERAPGLAAAAGGLATPAIRAVATVGGNLTQRNRCWYFRHPGFRCLQSGGDTCHARAGDHLFHAAFDLGPCVAPHPSTLAVAFVAWDARVAVHGGPERAVADLYGDGSVARDHLLEPGELLTEVILPRSPAGEASTWLRLSARSRAEWPLVEAVVRLRLAGRNIQGAVVVLGGVARIPLRLPEVEKFLVGKRHVDATWKEAGALATEGAMPLPLTRYKVPLIAACVRDALSSIGA